MELKNRSVRKQILLDEETDSQLKFLALNKQVSQNEIVNKALKSYFKRFKPVAANPKLGEE